MSPTDDHLIPISILLDIKQEIGALNAKLIEAAHSRSRLEDVQREAREEVRDIKKELQCIKPVVATVAEMKPQVKELMDFKIRFGAYLVVGGAIVAGVTWLLGQGITYLFTLMRAR